MEFTKENVLSALQAATSPTPGCDPQAAAEYLQQWAESKDGILIAFDILSTCENEYARVYSASLIKNQLKYFWGRIINESKAIIRGQFIELIKKNMKNAVVYRMLIKSLARIGIMDFPDEFPEFSNFIFYCLNEGTSDELLEISLKLLSKTCTCIEKSDDIITTNRKQFLRNYFIDRIDDLVRIVGFCFDDNRFHKCGLMIFNTILKWGKSEQIMELKDFLRQVCFSFVYNDELISYCIKCLITLLVERADHREFYQLVPLILQSFSSPSSKMYSGVPITSKVEIIDIIMILINYYFPTIVKIFNNNDNSTKTQSIISFLKESNISINDFYININHIFEIILSIRDEKYLTQYYWSMWNNLLRSIISEKNIGGDKNLTIFFSKLFEYIIQAMYEVIPLDLISEGITSIRGRSIWELLAKIDFNSVFNFIEKQDPSIYLCYAIGNLENSIPSDFDCSRLNQPLLLVYNQASDDSYYNASLIFCLEHTWKISTLEMKSIFFDYIVKCLADDDGIVLTAATNALVHTIKTFDYGFSDEFIESLCERSEKYLNEFEVNDGIQMYKICVSLVSKSNEENKQNFMDLLTAPLLNAMEQRYQLDKVFSFICEATYYTENKTNFLNILWEPLLNILSLLLNGNPDVTILEAALSAVAAGIVFKDFDRNEFISICEMMQNHFKVQDCFFDFFAVIRAQHQKIDEFLPKIISIFVVPATQNKPVNYAAIFNMFNEFDFLIVDDFMNLFYSAISSFNDEDVKKATKCLMNKMSKLSQSNLEMTVKQIGEQSLNCIFSALFDTFHQNSTQTLSNFLYFMFQMLKRIGQLSIKCISVILLRLISKQVPENTIFEFIDSLINNSNSLESFKQIIMTFLILMRKLSPIDYNIFASEDNIFIPFEEEQSDQQSCQQNHKPLEIRVRKQ